MNDVDTLVEPAGHGPEALECGERSLSFVPAFMDRLVEASRSTAHLAPALMIGLLVHALGNGVLGLPPPQRVAVLA
ncbi:MULTISPECIES: hypothetical protein [unclassified Streptomyces]|uniref:hypothetical protein n=1 Tax=unclassified Streptomyces TaxID=2593676 RepID=UPI00386998FB